MSQGYKTCANFYISLFIYCETIAYLKKIDQYDYIY